MNILAERSFPSFFKGYAPKLLKFYSDWLDWTEIPGNAQYILNHLSSEQDIDESIESYRTHLKKKLLPEFPERTATDLKLLLKNILWLYRAKSSRKAYDFMFRALFNSPASIWHPRDTMLKTSDGHWDVPQYVGIVEDEEKGITIDWLIENCLGWKMTGEKSRAEAFVGAASSGYSGSIECRASQMKSLARVAFYTDYGTRNQKLQKKLGTIECDPTLTAFRISNPLLREEDVTAVWSFDKQKRTLLFPAGTQTVELGTTAFAEPEGIVEGLSSTYDLVNLEVLVESIWRPVKISYLNGVLNGTYVDKNDAEHSVFTAAIEHDDTISFICRYPLRRKGRGTEAGAIATFYFNTTHTISYGSFVKTATKAVPLVLETVSFGVHRLSAESLFTGGSVYAEYALVKQDGQTVPVQSTCIPINELIDWGDVPLSRITKTEHFIEEPVSDIAFSLRYDFDLAKYVASIDRPVERPVTAICTIGDETYETQIPAGQTSAAIEAEFPDPIVTIGSKNIYGILIDAPTAHFAPGEKITLLDPETGSTAGYTSTYYDGLEKIEEFVSLEPEILWHAESEGHYTSTKGFLSDINAIQDNYYWQNYSYVVRSDIGIREWRNLVKTLIHPAGLEFFGEMMLEGGDLEDGKGIYYLEDQDFLRKSCLFFKRVAAMASQAITRAELILSTSRLAQRHSITSDLWLHWMQTTGDLRAEIKSLKRELFETVDPERRIELEQEIHRLEELLSAPYIEDIRDWYDIRPSDIDESLNANSVLLFRSDGTLINPLIVDWVDFSFTDDIDASFTFRGETVSPHTTSIWGTTLHPLHPMIHGYITGNEYVLHDGQEFIPHLHLAFVGSTQESSGVLVKTLVIGNEVLQYSDIMRSDMHEPALVKETDLQKLARKYLFETSGSTEIHSTGICPWKELIIKDFIYVNTDGGFAFNQQSLVKVPDAWTSAVETETQDGIEQKYVFDRNAWNNERISIVSYSPYDFSYRIWIERLNSNLQCSITAYDVNRPEGIACPLVNSGIEVSRRMVEDENGHTHSEPDVTTKTELVWLEPSGWNGQPKEVYATTTTWNMEFSNPSRQSSWFNIDLPMVVDNEQILCFVNGLLKPKISIDGSRISVDTIEDNSSIVYSSTQLNFGELSLEEYILDENEEHVLNEDGSYATRLVFVSTNESDNIPFGETTLQDWLVYDENISRARLADYTLQGTVWDIVGCSISDTLSYAEIYVLAPIEGSRKIQYPWFGWKMQTGVNEFEDPVFVWPFTYDNARLFQYSAHNEVITSIRDIEINPYKEDLDPKVHWEVEYRHVGRLLNGFQRSTLVSTVIASQRQSETVDRILERWWNRSSDRMQQDFLKNEHWLASANYSSTLLFSEAGVLVDPREFDWSNVAGDGGHEIGFPQKWWTRPVQAETPVEIGTIENGRIASTADEFKSEGYLAFVDGLKILDSTIDASENSYQFDSSLEGKEALIYSMGRDWLMVNGDHAGYFNAQKSSSGWNITTKIGGEYVQTDVLENLDNIDLVEFIGLSLGRKLGTIWAADDSVVEIKGSTEIASAIGDKRRFVDLTFLDRIDLAEPKSVQRLYGVENDWIFGIVDRIVDVDPRFFMVFIDGRHSPIEAREWRYIKGTLFINVEPEESVEVYIGNPYSHLLPDFAKCAPEDPGQLTFNNLRVNIVPRHMLTSTLWRIMEVGHMHFGRKVEVEWRKIFKMKAFEALRSFWKLDIQTLYLERSSATLARELSRLLSLHFNQMHGSRFSREVRWRDVSMYLNIGFQHERRLNRKNTVKNLSETFDNVAFWGQMDPSAWSGIGFNALSKTGRSSILAFNSDGSLIDPFNVDYHNGVVLPWTVGNVVEILTPESMLKMANVYWPVYEVDPELHSEMLPDENRYRELRHTDYAIAYVDGLTYDLERHFSKELQDLHTEESAYIFPREDSEFDLGRYFESMQDAGWDGSRHLEMQDEYLLLSDFVADEIETSTGYIIGVSMDAEYPMTRNVQIVIENGIFVVPVPRLGGEIVFVDGIKLTEGTFKREVIVNGQVALSTFDAVSSSNLNYSGDVQYALNIVDPVWKDNDEHVVSVYWPNSSWAERIAPPADLQDAFDANIQSDWVDLGFETYNEYIQSRFVLFCNGSLVHVRANADLEIFLNEVPLQEYECSSYELYVVDVSNVNCRTSQSEMTEHEQSFIFQNQQRNWFMESHQDQTFYQMHGLPMPSCGTSATVEKSSVVNMPVLDKENSFKRDDFSWVANNRDTMDNVFANGSLPVRQYVNPSLYVIRTSRIEVPSLDDYQWKVLGEGENVDELEFVEIDVNHEDENWVPIEGEYSTLVNVELLDDVVDGKAIYKTDYVPESWNFQLYATARENPEYFYPSERLKASQWKFYKGWNQRLEFTGIDPAKTIYIVEILDVSMEDSVANTDQVYWLEKEFNKKSTLIIDNEGLLEHPDGMEWIDGNHVFPHEGTWTAQAEEAEFPAVINELIPDNIKKARIMDLCLDDMVGYNDGINLVADASIEVMVAVNPRSYIKREWEVLANQDYIYWEEGEFKNWIAWLRDDDVFDPHSCFIFVNGFKVPDWMWTFEDGELPFIKIPLQEHQQITRLGFVNRDMVYDETPYEQNIHTVLIDPNEIAVQEADDNVDVIVDTDWVVWKDENGFPEWGNMEDVPDSAREILMFKPDPREGIIWPISRIWKYFNSCTDEGIDVPEYLGHDLSKYVHAWVDGRLVQCRFEGTRIFVPGCESAETVEVYVFELHDGAWIERFNAVPEPFTLTSYRDLRVC